PSATSPTRSPPRAAPGSPRRTSPTPAAGASSSGSRVEVVLEAVAAQPRGADELDRAQGRVRDDVELDAVALLDPEGGGLVGAHRERREEGEAGADRGDPGVEDAEDPGRDLGQPDRPEPAEGDPRRRLVRQGGGGLGAGQGVADAVGGALGPPQAEADDERRQPPDGGDDDRPGVGLAAGGGSCDCSQ